MMYDLRTNKEINPAVIPVGWMSKRSYGSLSISLESGEFFDLKAKLRKYNIRINQKEILCFLLSNYVAYVKGLTYDPIAMSVLKYGKEYLSWSREPRVRYSIGSIPKSFHSIVKDNLQQLPIKRMSSLVYYAITAFSYAPDRIINEMCDRIKSLKRPNKLKTADRYMLLKSLIPETLLEEIQTYAHKAGLTVNELMCVVLREACISEKERKENCHPISRLFSICRITKQEKGVFVDNNRVSLCVFICNKYNKECLVEFLSRQRITKSEMLRMAVRALGYVVNNRDKLANKVQYVQEEPEEEADEMSYVYSRMERMDFYRSIYR